MEDQYFFESIDQIQATAEPTRWKILSLLIAKPMTGSQLARVLGIPRPLAHYHLKILHQVGLVVLQEEKILGGLVEKYYCARARQFRTDRLIDRYRQNGDADAGDRQAGEVVGGLIRAMMEVARADLAHPGGNAELARIGFNFQDDVRLTREQINDLIHDLRSIGERYLNVEQQNLQKLGAREGAGLHHVRFTYLITPVQPLNPEKQTRDPEKTNTLKESKKRYEPEN